jgi:hypothetical protein
MSLFFLSLFKILNIWDLMICYEKTCLMCSNIYSALLFISWMQRSITVQGQAFLKGKPSHFSDIWMNIVDLEMGFCLCRQKMLKSDFENWNLFHLLLLLLFFFFFNFFPFLFRGILKAFPFSDPEEMKLFYTIIFHFIFFFVFV